MKNIFHKAAQVFGNKFEEKPAARGFYGKWFLKGMEKNQIRNDFQETTHILRPA